MAMSLPPQAFPWIANSSVERDALRERERQARAQRAGVGSGDPGGHPIFRAPIRVDPGQEDEISRRLRSTLGDFSQVQPWLSHDPNHLIGISRTGAAAAAQAAAAAAKSSKAAAASTAAAGTGGPLTASAASTWNGAAADPGGSRVGDPSSHHNSSSKHHPPQAAHHGSSSSASSNHHRSHSSNTTRHHPHHHHKKHQPPPLSNGQLKSSSANGKSTSGNNGGSTRPPQQPSQQHQHQSTSSSSHHQRSRTAPEQGRGDDVDKGSSKVPLTTSASNGPAVRTPTLRAPSKDVNNGVTATSAAPTSSATNTSCSQSSSLSIRTESSQKVSVSTSSSSSSRPVPPVVQEPKVKRPQPKLVIPPPETLETNPCASHPELESILKEMQKVPPPLTAIETPRKEDCRMAFPLSPVQDLDCPPLDDNDSKPVDRRKYASPPGSLQDDLEMSDSDDDEVQPSRKSLQGLSASKISTSNDNVSQPLASREKDSDSSDSEGSSSASGSDSESESSSSDASIHEANGEPSNTQGWMLSNFLNKPSSPATVGALPSRSNSVVHHPDSLIDEDSFTPILSQCPNPDADLGMMLKSPSPQGFDLVRSPKSKGTSNLLLSPVNSSLSHSPILPPHHSPEPDILARRSSTSDDDASCHVQNRRFGMRLSQTSPQHQPEQELQPTKAVVSTPEQPRKPWTSKGAKKMTSPTVPTLKRSKAELKEIPVREEEPIVKSTSNETLKAAQKGTKGTRETSQNRVKADPEPTKQAGLKRRTHSERRSEKRSKIHKSRVALSESSSEDETSKDLSDDEGGLHHKHAALTPSKLNRSENRSRSSSKTSLTEKVPPQTPPEPSFPEPSVKLEPPQLLSPIAQRCGSEVKENIEPPPQQECVMVSLALNRLLRLPGGKQCQAKGKGRTGDVDCADESQTTGQNKADALRQVYCGVSLPGRDPKSALKRKGGPDESKEKRRRLSSSSSACLWIKQEPPEPPPDEEMDSQNPWNDLQARPSGCDSPSSLSSFSSQRSGSRQHRSKSSGKSSANGHSEQQHQVKKEPKESQEKQKKSHRERKEGSGSNSSKSRNKVKQEMPTLANQEEDVRNNVRVQGSSSISSSQTHLWDGLLSGSEQSKATDAPSGTGGGGGGGGQLNPSLKSKEEPPDWNRNPQLLSGAMHRDLDTKSYSSDYYLGEAKNLKHQADKETDRTVQSMKYLEAVLFFILTGSSMERNHADLDKVYTMYKETLSLIRWAASSHKHISPKFQKLQNNVLSSIDNKLAILSLRCQSLLYQKLYKLRKNEVRKNLRALSDFQKSNPGKMASPAQNGSGARLQPSPCQPSPHSPTPSPAGSVGSQSSGYSSELGSTSGVKNGSCSGSGSGSAANGGAPAPLQPPSVAVPQAQYLMLQRQSATLTNLHRCHDLWEQADYLVAHNHLTDFFEELDKVCGGRLTLHSSSSELVKYVREGIFRLRNRLPGQDTT